MTREKATVEGIPTAAPADASSAREPQTVREIVDLIDEAWRDFYGAATSMPGEHMDEHIGEGWTRKQMLAHITAWHDLTNERLSQFMMDGKPVQLRQDEDTINARVARQAVGRTAGEVLKDVELSFQRLRRQVGRLTDDQLIAHDAWAAHVIAGNTFEHYAEHAGDVYVPPLPTGRATRR